MADAPRDVAAMDGVATDVVATDVVAVGVSTTGIRRGATGIGTSARVRRTL